MPKGSRVDHEMLSMALVGYTTQKAKIEAAIAEIRATLGSQATEPPNDVAGASPAGTRRAMSASARRRIAAAQKKRWADYHREHGQPVKAKRKLSAAGRKAIADAARRRWEALRKAKLAATSNA